MEVFGKGRIRFLEQKMSNNGKAFYTFQVSKSYKQGEDFKYVNLKGLYFIGDYGDKMQFIQDDDVVSFSGELKDGSYTNKQGQLVVVYQVNIKQIDKIVVQSSNGYANNNQVNQQQYQNNQGNQQYQNQAQQEMVSDDDLPF